MRLTLPTPAYLRWLEMENETMATLCPFCNCDPYEYVHNGVGLEPVAVTCCELGIELFNRREEAPDTVTIGWGDFIGIADVFRAMRRLGLDPAIDTP